MKKYLLSSIVVVSFLAYSLYERVFGIQTMPIVAPKNISGVPQFTPTPSINLGSSTASTQTPTIPLTPTPMPANSTTKSTPTSKPIPQNTPTPTTAPTPSSGYKDGTYSGDVADAFYGNIQVQATINGGKITNIQFLQYPNDRGTSIMINQQADPLLAQEAVQAQSAQVDVVSGATDSSQAFVQSLQTALQKAKS